MNCVELVGPLLTAISNQLLYFPFCVRLLLKFYYVSHWNMAAPILPCKEDLSLRWEVTSSSRSGPGLAHMTG